jgi:transposase
MACNTTWTPCRACWPDSVFPPQKPERRALERNEEAIRHWIDQDWRRVKRRAPREQRHIVFVDETGFLLHPLVQKTWAPRSQTPILRHRTRHHRRVSAIGGLSISPQRRRLGWCLEFHLDRSIRQEQVLQFLRHLLRHLRGRLTVIWDHLQAHQSRILRKWLRRCKRVRLEYLPGYAPELNPNEYGWAYLKGRPLANYCPADVNDLHSRVRVAARNVSRRQSLLRGFVHATGLPIRLY